MNYKEIELEIERLAKRAAELNEDFDKVERVMQITCDELALLTVEIEEPQEKADKLLAMYESLTDSLT